MKCSNLYGFPVLAGCLTLVASAIEAPSGSKPPPPTPSVQPTEAVEIDPVPAPVPAPEPSPVRPAPRSPAEATAYLGVGGYHAPELLAVHLGLRNGEGLVISSLDPGGPAAAAGLVERDVITRADGTPIASREDLTRVVSSKKPGDSLSIDFIHEGKPDRRAVTLATRPAGSFAAPSQRNPLDRMLQNFPQDQADRIRESIERSLQDHGMDELQGPSSSPRAMPPLDDAIDEMRKRAEKMFEGIHDSMPDAGISSASTIRLLDEQGSVELRGRQGGKEVRVLDKSGKEVWSGPWNTEQDKTAAPAEVRERVDRLNFDMDAGGSGLRLRLGPRHDGR